MPQDSESRHLEKVFVRLPDGMRDQLRAHAETAGRSMNAEIVHRLQVTLGLDEGRGVIVQIPPDMLRDLTNTASSLKVSVDKEIVDRLELTFKFDEEFGWAQRLKDEMGPVGAIIDYHLKELEKQMEATRRLLLDELVDELQKTGSGK